MNVKEMYERVDVLSDEIDVKEEEVRVMLEEIHALYMKIGPMKALERTIRQQAGEHNDK